MNAIGPKNWQQEVDNCTICQESLFEPTSWWDSWKQTTQKKVHKLACSHKFHTSCLQISVNEQMMNGRAVEGQGTCPNCRSVIDFSSSSKKVGNLLNLAIHVAAAAAMVFGVLFTAFILAKFEIMEPSLFSKGLSFFGGSFACFLALSVCFKWGTPSLLAACKRFHNWKTGLDLKDHELNNTEIWESVIWEKETILKELWILCMEKRIENWAQSENKDIKFNGKIFKLNDNIEKEQLESLLNQAYDDLPIDDPAVYAMWKNNAHAPKSENLMYACIESAQMQLVKFGILIPER